MHPVKYAIISAAGMGTRLELNMPKCMVNIRGRRVIDYLLDLLKSIENVRIVVGFMEEEVIDHVRTIRDDVVFVRNPNYQTTSNSYSLWLATRDLQEAFLAIDGDMLIEPDSFLRFLDACDGGDSVIGISRNKTEEAVFVELDNNKEKILGFHRKAFTAEFEWCGIACMKDVVMPEIEQQYIFSVLQKHLPLSCHVINCYEIDTPSDLEYALENFKP